MKSEIPPNPGIKKYAYHDKSLLKKFKFLLSETIDFTLVLNYFRQEEVYFSHLLPCYSFAVCRIMLYFIVLLLK